MRPRGLAVTLGLEETEHQPYKFLFEHFVSGKQGKRMLMAYANVNACCELPVGQRSRANLPRSNSIEASGKSIEARAFRSKEEHSIKRT